VKRAGCIGINSSSFTFGKNRPQYYAAIEAARNANDSGVFIEFTLSALYEIIAEQEKHQVKHQDKHQVELTKTQTSVLKVLKNEILTRKEIFTAISMSGDSRSFKRNIEPLLTAGLIKMTIPDKPNSRLQKYRITQRGKLIIE
jgi:Fic family protein